MNDLNGMGQVEIVIESEDIWYKIVAFLQTNWALIDRNPGRQCSVVFIADNSGVFDELKFSSTQKAEEALRINGFERYTEHDEVHEFVVPPEPPFRWLEFAHRPYSSGDHWRD